MVDVPPRDFTAPRKSLIIDMDREAHEELHKNVPVVPTLAYYALLRARRDFIPHDDPMHAIENLQRAVEQSKQHPNMHYLEKAMADLTLHALDLQKPYIDYSY